jgi:hypothetical protein
MKYLKTFESFSTEVEQTDEAFDFLKSKATVAENKFIEENKILFEDLKKAESNLKSEDEASKKALADIQKELTAKLEEFSRVELPGLLKIPVANGKFKPDADYNTTRKSLKDKITNVNPYDNRTGAQKFAGGAGSGRQ